MDKTKPKAFKTLELEVIAPLDIDRARFILERTKTGRALLKTIFQNSNKDIPADIVSFFDHIRLHMAEDPPALSLAKALIAKTPNVKVNGFNCVQSLKRELAMLEVSDQSPRSRSCMNVVRPLFGWIRDACYYCFR